MTKVEEPNPEVAASENNTIDKDPTASELVALSLLLVGPLILMGQAVYWLIYRVWLPLPVSRLAEWLQIPVPNIGYGKVAEMIEMVFGAPISLVLFVLVIVICLSVFETTGHEASGDESMPDEGRKRMRLAKLARRRWKRKKI